MDTTMRTDEVDDDGPAPDPRTMHALMEDQRRVAVDAQTSFVWIMEVVWGVAWILGYTTLWLVDGSDAVSLPLPVAVGIFAGLIGAGVVASIVLGIRGSTGLSTAALFHSRTSLLLGSILVVAALAAPFVGYPGNYLVMAVVGGGAYLVTGIAVAVRGARARRSLRARLG